MDVVKKGTSLRSMVLYGFKRLDLSWSALAVAAGLAMVAAGCAASDDVPSIERQAQEINRVVMCPVCPGESIDQSQHPLAVQMRAIVAEKLGDGWTAQQIKKLFVESYGPSVLLEPPSEGVNLMVWLIPPAAIAVAALVLYLVLRSMLRSQTARREDGAQEAELSEAERAAYFSRIEATLNGGAAAEVDELPSGHKARPT